MTNKNELLFLLIYFIISYIYKDSLAQNNILINKSNGCQIIKYVDANPTRINVFDEFTCRITNNIEGIIYKIKYTKTRESWQNQSDSLGLEPGNYYLKIFFNYDTTQYCFCEGKILKDSIKVKEIARPDSDIKGWYKWIKCLKFDIEIDYFPDCMCKLHYKIVKTTKVKVTKLVECPKQIYYPLIIDSKPKGAKIYFGADEKGLIDRGVTTPYTFYENQEFPLLIKLELQGYKTHSDWLFELKQDKEYPYFHEFKENRTKEYIILGSAVFLYGMSWLLYLHPQENTPKKFPSAPEFPRP